MPPLCCCSQHHLQRPAPAPRIRVYSFLRGVEIPEPLYRRLRYGFVASAQLLYRRASMRCQRLRTAQLASSHLKPIRASSCTGCSMRAAPSSAVEASKEFDTKSILRPHLLQLAPYTPIEPFEVPYILYTCFALMSVCTRVLGEHASCLDLNPHRAVRWTSSEPSRPCLLYTSDAADE